MRLIRSDTMSLSETEWCILDRLLEASPQSVAELVAVIGNPATIATALDNLHAAKLIERRGILIYVAPAPARP